MIQYSLQCSRGHRYNAWFKDASTFDEQKAMGLVTCAVCGEGAVEKALMVPAIGRVEKAQVELSSGHTEIAKLRAILRAYRQRVIAEADYVGDRFAEEARKIHFEEVDMRGIYGEASQDEIVGLIEDGVNFLPLPDIDKDN